MTADAKGDADGNATGVTDVGAATDSGLVPLGVLGAASDAGAVAMAACVDDEAGVSAGGFTATAVCLSDGENHE